MKKRCITLSLAVLMLALAGCKSDSDILATYNDGTITRGEFHNWIEAKKWSAESILKSKKQQKDKLAMMAVERIAIKEAKESGFDESQEFRAIAEMATESQLMKLLYNREIKDKATFEEPAIDVRHIFLKVRDFKIQNGKRVNLSKKELSEALSRAREKANMIIEKLGEGESFAELAKKHSDDFSKKKGGKIGYVVRDMLMPEYADAAFRLEEDEFTSQPVVTDKGIYIIKVEDKEILDQDNIEDVIDDKVQVRRLKNRLFRKTAQDYLDKLMKEKDVTFNEKNVSSGRKDAVIFKVGDRTFTVADLEKRIEMYNMRFKRRLRNAGKERIDATGEKKRAIAENTFKFELLKREAMKKGLDEDPDYIRDIKSKHDQLLAREYLQHAGSEGISISRQEMLDEYKKNREQRYYRIEKQKGKRAKKIEPFSKVKGQIGALLKRKKQSENIRKWREKMLKKYQFSVNEAELEGE